MKYKIIQNGFALHFLCKKKEKICLASFKKNVGFTLVELLVVVAIIGILSSFAMVSLNSARVKARDALRKGDMAQLRTALNLFYDDNDRYPICDGSNWDPDWDPDSDPPFGSTPENGSACYNDQLNTDLAGGSRPYFSSMPKEPKNNNNDSTVDSTYLYRYISDDIGSQYAIIFNTEDLTDDSPQILRGW